MGLLPAELAAPIPDVPLASRRPRAILAASGRRPCASLETSSRKENGIKLEFSRAIPESYRQRFRNICAAIL